MTRAALAFTAIAILSDAIWHTRAAVDTHSVVQSVVSWNTTCQKIATSVSQKSNVYPVASVNYLEDNHHWAASSSQVSACSFEPGTPEDVGIALQILGETRTPFAVKGGGHTYDPGFSSTEGVQIAMTRFRDIAYDSAARTVRIGAGLLWDDVYSALEPHGVNVVGSRVSGVGVAGFTLGGGYSWLTNQYGLTIDTVEGFQLVMPNGTVMDITETSSPDLFFGLKGGLNNFGIVTSFTLKVFPQTQVWGGVVLYTAEAVDATGILDKINHATANFAAHNTDPKAAAITSYIYVLGLAQPTVILFYDAPACPPGIFDEFLAIFPSVQDVGTRSFFAFLRSIPDYVPDRTTYNTVSLTNYTLSLVQSIASEANSRAQKLLPSSVSFINYDVTPFLPNLLQHSGAPSAYPPNRAQGFFPLGIGYSWTSPEFDDVVHDAIRETAQTIKAYAAEEGQDVADAALYPNYAFFDTPLVELYGANVPRLHAIKEAVDPQNVMGLAGGFKL